MMFIRFMFCLAVGLIGLCMVLMTVLETIFAEWDAAHELRVLFKRPQLMRRLFRRHDHDEAAPAALSTRLNPYGRSSGPDRLTQAERTLTFDESGEPVRF